jgi:hypothetical protein
MKELSSESFDGITLEVKPERRLGRARLRRDDSLVSAVAQYTEAFDAAGFHDSCEVGAKQRGAEFAGSI